MWRRGGRSDALDRAQALLSSKRSSRAAAESTQTSATKTSTHADVKSRHAPPNTNLVMSDTSDVSQVSSEPDVCGATRPAKKQEDEAQPQSPVGGGSRFLKKPPPPPPSSQSPVRQQSHVDRLLSSNSQTAALKRLAQIESRVHIRQRALEPLNQIQSPRSDVDLSSLSHAPEGAPVAPSSQPSSQGGSRFLKKNTTESPEDLHEAVESIPAEALLQKDVESGEEDVRKLVEDALDPPDENLTSTSSRSRAGTKFSRKVLSSASPPPLPSGGGLSSSCSPPQRRALSEARLLLSPSLQHSDSSRSAPEEVLSLEELFPVGCNADGSASEASSVSFQSDFEINVMTLDDLNPAPLAATEGTAGTQSHQADGEHVVSLPVLPSDQWVEQVADYESDFESASRREVDDDIISSQVSEHLAGGEEDDDVGSEVKDHIDTSWVRTEGDYSSTYSDSKKSCTLRTSGHSQRCSSSESRSSAPPSNHLKDVAAQTDANALWFTGSAVGMDYPTYSLAPPARTSELEGIATFQPDMLTLNDMLRQQLAMTRRFIESSRHQHASLLQSLGPPRYRYATLEDTMQYIRKHTHTK